MGNDFRNDESWFLTKKPGEKQVRPPVFYTSVLTKEKLILILRELLVPCTPLRCTLVSPDTLVMQQVRVTRTTGCRRETL